MSELKFVDLERFRFLTGHGKEFALEVDAELAAGDEQTGGLISQYIETSTGPDGGRVAWQSGALQVHFAPGYQSPYPAKYIVFSADKFSEQRASDALRYGKNGEFAEGIFVLSLILWRGNQRTVTNVPAITVMKQRSRLKETAYQVYSHRFVTDGIGQAIASPSRYIGVTRQGWQERWRQHIQSAKRGSHYKFHEAIRNHCDAQTVEHNVIGCYETEADAMAVEEKMVGYETLYPLGLNMIPGGYAGMKYLHKIGAIGNGERISPDDKQDIINRFFETASRKGIPNPLALANWQNPEYAEKVICGSEDRLKPEQIRTARFLASIGKTSPEIASEVGARNVAQVDRLLAGSTYSRVA